MEQKQGQRETDVHFGVVGNFFLFHFVLDFCYSCHDSVCGGKYHLTIHEEKIRPWPPALIVWPNSN